MWKWWPLTAICLGAFTLIIDTTVVTVALPDIAAGLHASLASRQWVANVYTLTLAVLALSAGAIGDLFGQRRVFTASVALFAVSSAACALAPDIGVLIAARAVQGVGAAAMMVAAMSLLGISYDGKDRGVAFGVLMAVLSGAGAAGPFLGGVFLTAAAFSLIAAVLISIHRQPSSAVKATPRSPAARQ